MIIERIEIGKFGTFENASFNFTDGVNMIEGGNESGKSTIADFIRFIFYGLSKEETPLGSEWQRYILPFKRAEGALQLSCRQGRFRIERSIDLSDKKVSAETVEIFDLQIGAPIRGKDPAALFLGVPRAIFDRSLFMAQLDGRAVYPVHLGQAVENMLSSADETINAEKSAEELGKEIGILEGAGSVEGSIAYSKERTAELEKRMTRAIELENEYNRLGDSLKEYAKKSENNKNELAACQKRLTHVEALRTIERADKAQAAAGDLEKTCAELAEAKSKLAYGDFLPDKGYVKALSQTLSETLRADQNINDAAERTEESRKRLAELPEPVGGREGKLLTDIGFHEKRAASARGYGVAAAAAALLFLGLCILFIVLKMIPGAIVCGVLALAGAGLAAWFFYTMKKENDVQDALYEGSGADDREELADAVARNAKLISDRENLEKSIADGEKQKKKYEDARAAQLEKGRELAARWGRECDGVEALKALCVDAEDAYEKVERLTSDEKQAKLALSALAIDVPGEELERLRALVSTDGIDEEYSDEVYKDLAVKVKFYKQTSDALDGRIEAHKKQRRDMESSMEDKYLLEEEIAQQKEKTAALERALTVRKTARAAILESVAFMRAQILPDVMNEASAFFETASAGKYVRLDADEHFAVTALNAEGDLLPLGALSGALTELVYMALRFSVTGKLYGGAQMPVVLDESFSNLDDLHLAAAFKAVYARASEKKNQIILTTCRKRETALMELIGPINRIVLP